MSGETRQHTRIQTANREMILEAALPVFSQHGFKGATVDRIAEAAGMSKPNLLYYFRRKQDVYAAVLERILEQWLAPLERLSAAGDPETELSAYIAVKLRLSAEAPEASRLFANEILRGAPVIGDFLKTRLRDLVHEKAEILRIWQRQGRLAAIEPEHLIFMIWATTQHYADFAVQVRAVMGHRADESGFWDDAARNVLALLMNGVRPR